MARTPRRDNGGNALTDLMRKAGAEPRRQGPRGPKHRAEPAVVITAEPRIPSSGRLRRISALSAGGLVVGGLVVLLVAPSESVDVISGIPPAPPSLTIAPQAVEVPGTPTSTAAIQPGPPGGDVAPPPALQGNMNGISKPSSETPPPPPPPPATTSAAPDWPDYRDYPYPYDPRYGDPRYGDRDRYNDGYYNDGHYDGGGRRPGGYH